MDEARLADIEERTHGRIFVVDDPRLQPILQADLPLLLREVRRLRGWLAAITATANDVKDEPADSYHVANALAVIRSACERAERGHPARS